ncbi:MAG: MEDS domain-containing protein [Nitrososphaerales archaeon]
MQFYSDDDELIAEVVAHLAIALATDGTAIVVATEAHRCAFAAGLAALGLAPDALDRLTLFDAEEMLQKFLVDGEPDADRFDEVFGEFFRASKGPVHAYGEMVATLWGSGQIQQAIDVEGMWNSLGESSPSVLLCGYPNESCLWNEQANALARVCAMHGAVTGSAAPSRNVRASGGEQVNDAEHVLSLPREVSSVRCARAKIREVLTNCPTPEWRRCRAHCQRTRYQRARARSW